MRHTADVLPGAMDFSGLSLIKLKKEEMEAQVGGFMPFRNLEMKPGPRVVPITQIVVHE